MLAEENEALGKDVTAARAEIDRLKAKMVKHDRDYALHDLQTKINDAERAVGEEFEHRLSVALQRIGDGADIRDALHKWIVENSDNYKQLVELRREHAQIIQTR